METVRSLSLLLHHHFCHRAITPAYAASTSVSFLSLAQQLITYLGPEEHAQTLTSPSSRCLLCCALASLHFIIYKFRKGMQVETEKSLAQYQTFSVHGKKLVWNHIVLSAFIFWHINIIPSVGETGMRSTVLSGKTLVVARSYGSAFLCRNIFEKFFFKIH